MPAASTCCGGRGTVDMKGGVATQLRVAQEVREPIVDLTFVFYEGEEIDSEFNGLLHVQQQRPDLIDDAAFAVLLEPTDGLVEGGCKGTLRAEITTKGIASHSARPWKGHNAIHDAGEILGRLAAYQPRTAVIDGLDYIEALNAVLISGGIAGNVIPDRCVVTVNYRYAPRPVTQRGGRSCAHRLRRLRRAHRRQRGGRTSRSGAAGGAGAFVAALGVEVTGKQGWTDVARFSAMGIPAVNYGPGDPNLAHMDDEQCPVEQLRAAEAAMTRWLTREGA
jgi:succinyl-diaminopimelate desuccinylase